jgi:hypothetical protein
MLTCSAPSLHAESEWVRGGRLLSIHTSNDDGTMTSLAVDDDYIVIGMANREIHVFEAESGTFIQTLVGHDLGVWCLTLISAGCERVEDLLPGQEGSNDNGEGREMGSEEANAQERGRCEPSMLPWSASPPPTQLSSPLSVPAWRTVHLNDACRRRLTTSQPCLGCEASSARERRGRRSLWSGERLRSATCDDCQWRMRFKRSGLGSRDWVSSKLFSLIRSFKKRARLLLTWLP